MVSYETQLEIEQAALALVHSSSVAVLTGAGVSASVADGVKRAREAVAAGRAQAKLEQFVVFTQKLKAA